MATKISLLPSAVAGNLTGATKMPVTDASNATTGPTWAQLRTAIFAQGTGYATNDPLVVGGTLSVTGAATFNSTIGIVGNPITVDRTAAANGVLTLAYIATLGTDATLGPLNLFIRGMPSATGASRYVEISAQDNAAYRLINFTGAVTVAATLGITGGAGINGKTPVANVAAPTAAGASYGVTEQTLLNDIRTRLINFGIYT